MSEHMAEFEVLIAARPQTVFSMFVDQAAFAQWMGAQMGVATIEPRIGGAVRVDYGGGWKIATGEVVELEEPTRFSFTWGYEDGQPFAAGATRVDITLSPTAEGTRLVLRHSGLPSEVAAREHEGGWRLYTGILGHMAAGAEHRPTTGDVVAAWFDAWGSDDPAQRDAAVARCFAEDGTFHHPYALVAGRSALARHIASSRRHMQGVEIVADGPHEQVHQHIRFGWRLQRGGEVLARGANVATLAPDGRMVTVVGFTDR